jgi:hypothetical protein
MYNNYETRKVDRFESDNGFVSTAKVSDSRDPYETGIQYKPWGPGVVIVQTYETLDEAKNGHQRYVELFVSGELPQEKPLDTGTNIWSELARKFNSIEE